MRRGTVGIAALVAAVVVGGCSEVVPGRPAAAPPGPPDGVVVAISSSASPAPRSGLVADVVADECLLDAADFGALVGATVQAPAQGSVRRSDGSSASSCVATTGSGPIAMINVYAVLSGTPADFVRAGAGAGRRELTGVGDAAAVIDTETGPTLHLASGRYLITILVAGPTPSDAAWRAAGATALARLPA